MPFFNNVATLPDLIEERVRQHPCQPAIRCEHDRQWEARTFSYERLNQRANQLARRLRAQNVRAGDVVAIQAERSFGLLIAMYAVLKAGAAYLPLSPEDPPERTAFILEDARAKLLICHA